MLQFLSNKSKGGGVIEAPLVIMVIVMLLVFFAGYTYSYYNKMVLNMIVLEGARNYAVHQNVEQALEAARKELTLGNVADTQIYYDSSNNHIVAVKNIGFYIPLNGKHLFRLVSSAEFRKEDDTLYFRKGID